MGLIYCYTIYGVYLDKGEGGEIIHRMLTFHSIWTKPATLRGVEEMSLWDFEWLTWLAGILEARNCGPVVLVADERGKTFVEKVGLAKFYDEIVLGLDHIPSFIDPEIFWAAGKLYAIRLLKKLKITSPSDGPVCSLDWDCIPWNYPKECADIMCLNLEQLNWAWYKDCQSKYAEFAPNVNWELAPANNGVIHFKKYKDMLVYGDFSTGFMESFSAKASTKNYFNQPRYVYGDAMTFAEQQLLSSAAHSIKKPVEPFLPVRDDGFLPRNAFFTHLWTTKTLYRAFPEARIHYTNQLIQYLRKAHPICIATLREQDLHITQPFLTSEENATWNKEGLKHFKSYNVAIVKELQGSATLRDRNIPGARELRVGSIVLPGDRLTLQDNSSKIELEFNQATEYVN